MKAAGQKPAILPDSAVDPNLTHAEIRFLTGKDGKEASTTPVITVQCKDDGPVVVAELPLEGTGAFDYEEEGNALTSPNFDLALTTDAPQATKSMLAGGDYVVRIEGPDEDGWDFTPTLTLRYSDGSEGHFTGSYVRLTLHGGPVARFNM